MLSLKEQRNENGGSFVSWYHHPSQVINQTKFLVLVPKQNL